MFTIGYRNDTELIVVWKCTKGHFGVFIKAQKLVMFFKCSQIQYINEYILHTVSPYLDIQRYITNRVEVSGLLYAVTHAVSGGKDDTQPKVPGLRGQRLQFTIRPLESIASSYYIMIRRKRY